MGSEISEKDAWQEILNKAFEGHSEALGSLWQNYLKPKIYAFAISILKNPQDAEDTIPEVFMKLLKDREKIRNHVLDGFEAFVFRITKNACIDFLRTHKDTDSTLHARYKRILRKIGENKDLRAYWNDIKE